MTLIIILLTSTFSLLVVALKLLNNNIKETDPVESADTQSIVFVSVLIAVVFVLLSLLALFLG